MPNVKIYADEAVMAQRGAALRAALEDLRILICGDLRVQADACQIALLTVTGLGGQPPVNVELLIMPRPDRPPELIRQMAGRVRDLVAAAAGAHCAVRVAMLDAATYVALK